MSEQQGRRYAAVYHTGRQALLTDQVLTSGQLLRVGSDPDLFPSLTESVRVTSDINSERAVTFHALTVQILHRLAARQMAHLAGVAEMRLELGVPPGPHWVSKGQLMGEVAKPDAVWHAPDGPRMIEFDSCDYPRRVVQKKLERFSGLGPVYWGMSSALRAERWSSYDRGVHFMYVPWWEGPEERTVTAQPSSRAFTRRAARQLERNQKRFRQAGL